MTQLATPTTTIAATGPIRSEPARWRWAGGFGLAYIVVMMAAFASEGAAVENGTSPAGVAHAYARVGLHRILAGGFIEATAFLVLVPGLVLMSRVFGRSTETGRVAAQSFLGLGLAYVSSTLAIGFTPMFAAAYGAHHHIDPAVLATVNDLRNYAFVLQVATSLAMGLALGIAALADRSFPVLVGWGGVVIGGVGLVAIFVEMAVPAATDLHNLASMVQMIWWVVLSIACLRGGPKNA